jgi:Uma2 family endonuclease
MPTDYYTPEQYLKAEHVAETRSEYYAGRIYAMAGGTKERARTTMNLGVAVAMQLRGTPCQPFSSDLRVKAGPLFTYPGLAIACGKLECIAPPRDTLTNPTVIFEVLSEGSEGYDRGQKFACYCMIESLREYVLVTQDRPRIERFVRQPDGSWSFTVADGLEAVVPLTSGLAELNLYEVYEGVDFPVSPPLRDDPGRPADV